MRIFLASFLLVTSFTVDVFGETGNKKYRYPLNINNGYSSSFQEFRSNHFHAGMDLRTFQKTGYPVFAIAAGKLIKIRMVKRGSGRGLYIKHPDGNTSIYFHLDRFNSSIEAIVSRVQKARRSKYFGNYLLQHPLNIKRGEVIAYSGETGYGFPHLHMEIRDNRNAAVNPFPLINHPGRDKNHPVIRYLILRNKTVGLINGKIGEQLIKFRRHHDGRYELARPVIVSGYFDCLLGARDISDSGKYVAPYTVSFFIDGNQLFGLRFDRFIWEDNNQLGFVYDLQYSRPGNYLFNLFFQRGFELEEKKSDPDSFYDQMNPGTHACRVVVGDNFGNISTGYFDLIKMEPPLIEVGNVTLKRDSIILDDVKIESPGSDRIMACLLDRPGHEILRGDIQFADPDKNRQLVLEGINGKPCFLDFLFFKAGIIYHRKRIRLKPDVISLGKDIDFTPFINRHRVFLKINNPLLTTGDLDLKISQGSARKTVKALESNESIFFMFTPDGFQPDVHLDFIGKIDANSGNRESVQKKVRLICLDIDARQTFQDDEFSAEFYPHAVNERKVLWFDTRQFPSKYPVLSREISLYPYHFPFLDYVYFKFRMLLENPLQVGIFRYHLEKENWGYVPTQYDNTTHTFKTKVISSGVFALMRDVFPPVIVLNKIPSTHLDKVKRLTVTITDRGKGVNDETLTLLINNHPVDCEYDPDWRQVKIDSSGILKRGENSLRVSVADFGGNRTSRLFRFTLR